MIDIRNIHLEFDRVLIDDGQLKIKNGLISGIIGESGTGKTALLQEIGLLGKCQHMDYYFNGLAINKMTVSQRNEILRQDICFISQDIYLFSDMTISEMMRFYASFLGKTLEDQDIYQYLHEVHLQLDIHTPADNLSGGEKQRLMIACGLLKNAQLFIFDEPFAYLDKRNIENIFEIIQKLAYQDKKMIIITSHDAHMYERFDCLYQIEDQHLVLLKDKETEEFQIEHQSLPFHFHILIDYIHSFYQKHCWKYISLGTFISLIVSLMIVMISFQSYFEQANGNSLLNILKNEVCIIRGDGKDITPTEVAELRSHLYDYTIYPYYGYTDVNKVIMKGYLDNEEECFSIYETIGEVGTINDKEVGHVYMSYSLYRHKNSDVYETYSLTGTKITLKVTGILNPSEGDNVIYVPYDEFTAFFKSIGIELDLTNVTTVIVPIQSIDDISNIKQLLSNDYQFLQSHIIDLSIQAATLFNKSYIKIVSVFVIVILGIYKLFDTLKIRKDDVLFKMNGIENKALILMKMYREGLFFIVCLILTVLLDCLILAMLHLFVLSTFIDLVIKIIGAYLGLFVFLMLIYVLIVNRISTVQLLRMNLS